MAEWIGQLLSGAPFWVAIVVAVLAGLLFSLAYWPMQWSYRHETQWAKRDREKKEQAKKEKARGKK